MNEEINVMNSEAVMPAVQQQTGFTWTTGKVIGVTAGVATAVGAATGGVCYYFHTKDKKKMEAEIADLTKQLTEFKGQESDLLKDIKKEVTTK